MKSIRKSISTLIIITMFFSMAPQDAHATGLEYIDLSTWEQKGNTDSGDWELATGNRTVTQLINYNPTFYVSPDDIIDKVVQGTIQVKTTSDDDFIGFVFGFKEPAGSDSYPYDFYLFDWKKSNQSPALEGYRLMRVDAPIGTDLWGCEGTEVEILAEAYGDIGWTANTLYTFKLIYGSSRIKILIDDEVIFDVTTESSFQTGKFGFYNYSQAMVEYGNVQSAPASFEPVAPIATDDSYGMDKNTTLPIDRYSGIFANDYDPNLDTYTMELISSTSNGSLSLNQSDGSFTYTPNGGYEGVDAFTYQLTDSTQRDSRVATVSISVQEPNVAPTDITITNDEVSLDASDDDTIGYLSTVDGNANDSFDYLLLDSIGGCFGISGNELYVNNSSLLEYGTMSPKVRTVDLRDASYDKTFSISVTDNNAPTAPSISVGPSGWTGSATITVAPGTDSGSGVEKTEYRIDEGQWTTYSSQFSYSVDGDHMIEARTLDNAGNSTSSGTKAIKIDGTDPTAPSISVDPAVWTSGSALITVVPGTDSGSGVKKTEYRIDGGAWTVYTDKVTFEEDGEHTVEARTLDNADNSTSSGEYTVRIDNANPTIPSITINPVGWTTGSALVTITPGTDSGSGVSGTKYRLGDGDWISYTEQFAVSTEGALDVKAKTTDNVGNEALSETVTIEIDRTAPVILVADFEEGWTKHNITVTVSNSENDGLSDVSFNAESHEFTSNGSFIFIATDEAGNTDSETVSIDNIDKTKPTISVTGNPEDWTSGSAVLSWAASDSQSYNYTSLPDGTTSSALTGTCTALVNGDYAFTAHDQAGNTASQTVSVEKIDKIDPIVLIADYETDWTNENITVEASDSADDELSTVSFNEISHEFTSNGSFTFTATDAVGNTDSETVTISNIDKVDPVISITGDNPYKIDLDEEYTDPGATATDEASGIDGSVSSESTVNTSRTGTYTVTYTVSDKAGNEVEAVRIVEVVDPIAISWISLEGVGSRAASVKASIDSLGASGDIVSYGLVWSNENSEPTIEDSHNALTELSEPGEFISTARNLSSSTNYYARVYAEDSTGVKYSGVHTFKTDKKPVTSIEVQVDPETTEPETDNDGREVFDFTKATSVPEVTGTIDGEWLIGEIETNEEGQESGQESSDTLLEFGTESHSITLPVTEFVSDGGEDADQEGEESPKELESCEVAVREETTVKTNWLLSDVPDEQKEDREVVSTAVTYEVTANMSDGSEEKIDTFDSYVERKLTVESDESIDVSRLVAVRFDEMTGEFVSVPAKFEEKEDGTVVAVVSDSQAGSYAIVENNRDYASELPESHWAADTAVKMSKKLMLEEVFDDGMDLEVGITRAEMSGVLLKTLGINKNAVESDKNFDDLPEGSKWHDTVVAATEAGILKGYGDGSVKPEQVISREEMAAVIFRTMDRMIEMAEERDKVIYEDHEAIKAWALGQVNALTDIEVFEGYESGTFMPESNIKIGEALTALYRMSKHLNFMD